MNKPFAAIPLEWKDYRKNTYHEFLLFLSFRIAGTDGFQGLQAGQVKFSRRELEQELGIGNTKSRSLIAKAISEKLLIPLNKHGYMKGDGEVYETAGELKESRLSGMTNPTPTQPQHETNPTKPLAALGLDVVATQLQPNPNTKPTRLKDKTKRPREDNIPSGGGNRLEEALTWDGVNHAPSFWELLSFFPKNRKTYPLTIAQSYRNAILKEHADPAALVAEAKTQFAERDPMYVPNAAKWISEGGWMVADLRPEPPKPQYVVVPYQLPQPVNL